MSRRKLLDPQLLDDILDSYSEARHLAYLAGLILLQRSEYHFQLLENADDGWLLNIYPTSGRVHNDHKRPSPMRNSSQPRSLIRIVRLIIAYLFR